MPEKARSRVRTPRGTKSMADLIIHLPDGRTLRHQLGMRPVVLGRDAGCDVPTDDPSTSRRHARISPTSAGYMLEDLGSKNGTLINEQLCKGAVRLQPGDQVVLGATRVVYHEGTVHPASSVIVKEDLTRSRATHYVARDKKLALSQRRLEMIYDLSERLTTLQDQEQLLDTAMSICFETLNFERGAIGIRRRNSRAVDWPVVRNLRGAEGELTISRTLLGRAMDHGERAIFTDDGAGTSDPTVSMVQHGIRSAMCVPMLHGEQTLGVLYGDRTTTSTTYTAEDIDFFAAIARQVSIGLVNAHLLEDQRRMERMHHDLDVARKIQAGLFPSVLPNRDKLRVAALNDPGQGVSGDYYDVLERADGSVWWLIADVTGEGVSAALMMANFQAAVRVTIDEHDDPAGLLALWNRFLCRNSGQAKFITCLIGLIDPAARTVRLSSAGHHSPLLLRVGATPTEIVTEGGLPLGIDAEATFASSEVSLGEGPVTLLSYTDGITEAMDPSSDPFGLERLIAAAGEHPDPNPQSLLRHVRKQVSTFAGAAPQSDDITLLGVWVG